MMEAPLRIGAIGCGGFATGMHFTAMQGVPELKLAALCDINDERLQGAAAQFGVAETFSDFNEMLDKCQLDAVCVIGPPSLHVTVARVCLERQIPFFSEKPLATTADDARELDALAAKHGDCGQVGYTSRYSPAQRLAWRISRLPEFGLISDVTTTHLTQCHMHPFWDITDPTEAFINLHGVHAIDLWRFFGGDPVEVSASLSARRITEGGTILGSILVYVRTADGPHGTIRMKAGNAHNGEVSSDVTGEYTRVRVDNGQTLNYEGGQDWVRQVMAGDVLEGMFLPEQPVGRFVGNGLVSHSYVNDFFRFEWIAFARALLGGKPLSPSIQDACKTVFLTDAICRSLREGGGKVNVER